VVPTLQDVADEAQVSRAVASRALSGDPRARISRETRWRILEAAERLGYQPNQLARGLRTARANAVALVVPSVTNAVFAELVAGVESAAASAGSAVLLAQLGSNLDLQSLVGEGRVDGVILQRDEVLSDDELLGLLDIRQPVVLFNSRLEGHVGSVILPDEAAARLATEHLLQLGHRRIGFLGGPTSHDAARRRRAGFLAAVESAGLDIEPGRCLWAGWEADAGASAVAALHASVPGLTGIVVASVNAALGAMATCLRLGLRVPEDVSIISVHDTWFAEVSVPALTVIRMPMRSAGKAAASMLLERLDGGSMRDIVVSEPAPHIALRGSTGPARQ
jgi:LacI family transcriptional regulator